MKKISIALVLSAIALFIAACGSSSGGAPTGKVIKSGPVGNNLTVALSNTDGIMRKGQQEIFLTFTDAGGKPVEVGAVSFNNYMPAMGTMPAMNHAATLTTTGTPGNARRIFWTVSIPQLSGR